MTLSETLASNINPDTSVPYGYVAAAALDRDVVDILMDGNNATDHTWSSILIHAAQDNGYEGDDVEGAETYLNTEHGELLDELMTDSCDEREVSGVYEDVHYMSSWLGGALNFFITLSPYITYQARLASPCVPNAGILDTLDGEVMSYNVPNEWRYENR